MKKKSFAKEIFANTEWLPQGFEISEVETDHKNQLKKKPQELSKSEAIGSMKNFTDKVLESQQSQKVVLKDVEIIREKSKVNYELKQSESSLSLLGTFWKNELDRIEFLKSHQKIKLFFIVQKFRETSEDRFNFDLCFNQEQASLFTKMVSAMGVDTKHIFVSAIEASDSSISQEEIINNLHHELNILNPDFIVCFGAMATHKILQKKVRLSLVQGEFFSYSVGINDGQEPSSSKDKVFTLMPLFHPEYLLINPNMKRKTWAGMQKIMERM